MARQFTTVEQFHEVRRMFAVCGGTLLIALPGTTKSHADWLADLCGKAKAERYLQHATRGYLLDGELRAYSGPDFSANVEAGAVYTAMMAFQGMGAVHTIGFGAVKADGVIQWPASSYVNAWRWAGEYLGKNPNAGRS